MADVHIPRNRSGGVFIDADNIKLHANDFDWEDKLQQLTEGERACVEAYIHKCEVALVLLGDTIESTDLMDRSSWEKHYSTNRHHFPLKNYIIEAFPILKACLASNFSECHILECGCGTGSTLLPLMRFCTNEKACFVGCDVSTTALKFFSEHFIAEKYISENRLHLFPFDIVSRRLQLTVDSIASRKRKCSRVDQPLSRTLIHVIGKTFPSLTKQQFDFVLLVFVLSALPTLFDMIHALKQIREVIKPEGFLLFRDYAVADNNFFRFIKKHNHTIGELFFSKGDSTTQFFFEKKIIIKMMKLARFEESSDESFKLQYHCNRIVNRKNKKSMDKIFLNGVFCPCL